MRLSKLTRRKFEELSAMLKRPPKTHQWDYHNVGGPGWRIEIRDGKKWMDMPAGHCGSAGCAIGLWRAVKGEGVDRPRMSSGPQDQIVFYGGDLKTKEGDEDKALWIATKPIDVARSIDRMLRGGRVGLRDIVLRRLAKEKRARAARRAA